MIAGFLAGLFTAFAVFFGAAALLLVYTEQWHMLREMSWRASAAAFTVLCTWIGLAVGCAFAALRFAAL